MLYLRHVTIITVYGSPTKYRLLRDVIQAPDLLLSLSSPDAVNERIVLRFSQARPNCPTFS